MSAESESLQAFTPVP